MRILIQHTETRLYLSKGSRWTDKRQEALAFLNEVRALDYCIYHRLTKVAVAVVPENPSPEPAAEPKAEPRSCGNQDDIEIGKMKPKAVKQSRTPKNQAVAAGSISANKQVAKTIPPVTATAAPIAKQTAPREAAPRKISAIEPHTPEASIITTVAAKIDVGLGNTLFIRGQGDGLNWEQGTPLHCAGPSTWLWTTKGAKEKVVFKLLLNDQVWSQGEDLTVEAGKRVEVVPVFQ
jgi:hypothetical protein